MSRTFDILLPPGRRAAGPAALTFLACLAAAGGLSAQAGGAGKAFLTHVRQVTFEGRRAGEGYFSADGSLMIFQSEREPGNPFYQIYVMDLATGDTHRVSPGVGKTTCAWIHPDGKRVLFASTHADPRSAELQKRELELRATGKERRYAWDYDEHYDIYVAGLDGKNLVNLTHARGYDAEGSFSPDGKLIVFASNRHAYTEPMSDADRKRFAYDKAYLLDLYVMNADGSNVRRLTNVKGYDGGPFFSPDGRRICFRRFNEPGDKAEVFTIGVDGTDEKQLTHLGVLSWAPFYHPSGDYLIFSTNKHGFKNFELYLVDAEGRHEPVRVTTTPDGDHDLLPVFFPDGQRLAWTATRNGAKKGQIFFADWNDALARARLGLGTPDLEKTADAIRPADIALHVRYLASDRLAGRATGSAGARLAGDYIASVFRHLGLEPAGAGGTFFQPFAFTAGVRPGPRNRLWNPRGLAPKAVPGRRAPSGEPRHEFAAGDWVPLPFSRTGEVEPAPVVFAGYGLAAPAVGKHPAYDSLAGLEVQGAWVMVLDGAPRQVAPGWREHLARHAGARFKALVAGARGARGLIVVRPESGGSGPRSALLKPPGLAGEMDLAAIAVPGAVASAIVRRAHRDLDAIRDRLDHGDWVDGFTIPSYRLAATLDLVRERRTGRNVLGRLDAGEAPLASAVVFGAHYDHLGRGELGRSLARGADQGKVHPGADDNASGVAGVLEAAQWLASLRRRGKLAMKHDIVFAAWSGEEIGVLGSSRFVRSQRGLAAPDSINPPIIACLNLDMIGRLRDHLTLQGVGSSSVWLQAIERRNVPVGLAVKTVPDCILPSDTTPFYLKKVPILAAFTGAHADYHTPRDTADRLNYEGAARVTRLMALIARGLVQREQAPDYRVAPRGQGSRRARAKVALGTLPDYGAEVKGVKLEGVRPGGPAARAGVQGGDVVVELAGRTVANLRDYMAAMDAMAPGKSYPMVVIRGGKRLTLTLVPEAR